MTKLIPIRDSKRLKAIVFFPYAGGLSSFFYSVAPHINPEYDLFVIEYSGRFSTAISEDSLSFHELSLSIIQQLSEFDLQNKSLHFCGISMGGYLAYHIVQLMEHYYGKGINMLTMISVCSEDKLRESLQRPDWLESFLGEYTGVFEQDFLDFLKELLQKDRDILTTMQLGSGQLTKTPIRIFNALEDTHCHSENTKRFWLNKTSRSFDYQTYQGKHIPHVEQLCYILHER